MFLGTAVASVREELYTVSIIILMVSCTGIFVNSDSTSSDARNFYGSVRDLHISINSCVEFIEQCCSIYFTIIDLR